MNNLQTFYKKFEFKIFLLMAVLLGFTPLSWFNGKLVAGEEFYALDYGKWADVFSKTWAPYINYGESSILTPLKLQGLFFNVINLLGLQAYQVQIVWYVFLWTLTSAGFYHFVYTLFSKKINALALFVTTVFYVYSPYLLNISALLTPPRLVFVALPFVLLQLLQIYRNSGLQKKRLFLIVVILFLISPVFVNLPSGLVVLMLVILGLAHKYLLVGRYYKNFFLSAIYFLGLFILLSLWWIFPVAIETLSSLNPIKESAATFSAISASGTSDILSLFGSWAFREKIHGYDYYYFPFFHNYDVFPLLLIRVLPLVLVILGFFYFLKKTETKKSISADDSFFVFLIFVFLIFMFLSKGATGALGSIYSYMYNNLPFFWVFREPYAKFMPVVAVTSATLMLLGLSFINQLVSNVKHFFNSILLILLVCFIYLGFPLWNGDVVWKINDRDVRSYEVQIPDYWSEFADKWGPRAGYYLLYPSLGMTDRYIWPSGYIGNPFLLFTDGKFINTGGGYITSPSLQQVVTYIYNKLLHEPEWFKQNANRYNLSGFILQSDTSDKLLTEKKDVIKEKYLGELTDSFGPLEVFDFENAQQNELPSSKTFEIIPGSRLLWMDEAAISQYSLLKEVAPPEAYFVFTNDEAKVNSYFINDEKSASSVDYNVGEYSFKIVRPNLYKGFFKNSDDFVYDLVADKTSVNYVKTRGVSSFNLEKNEECCDSLTINSKAPVELTVEDDWVVLQKDQNGNYMSGTGKGTLLDISTTNTSYYKQIKGYDPSFKMLFLLNGVYSGNSGFSFFTVQRDLDVGREIPVSGGVIKSLNQQVSAVFPETTFVDSSYNSIYSLVFRKPEPFGLTKDAKENNSLRVDSVKAFKLFRPPVLLLDAKFGENSQENINTTVEERKISSTLFLIKTPVNLGGNSYLQFKNAYKKWWSLVPIDQKTWELGSHANEFQKKLLELKIGLKAFGSGDPENLEYYSNLWRLESPQNYYAVVYFPQWVSETLFIFSVLFILYYGIKSKWRRS